MDDRGLESLQRFIAEVAMRHSAVAQDAAIVLRAEKLVLPSSRGMSPADRLDVYREQFWLRHVPSLEEDYPTLSWVLGGTSRFRDLAIEYLSACPPRTWDLQKLGDGLPAYLADHAPWSGDPLAHDAARLDWAFMEAFDAADAAPFDPSTLTAAPEDAWPLATIVFHPAVRALTLAHPVHELRHDLKNGRPAPHRPPAASTHVVVWRDVACCLQMIAVEGTALALMDMLIGGAPLGRACDAVARLPTNREASDLGPRVSSWFQQWTANGWVSAVRFPG